MKDYKFKGMNGKWFVVRCEKCHRENCGPAVATGVCAWCGWDANTKVHKTVNIKRN